MSLKIVAKPAVISDQGLCEDLLRRASYIIQLKKKEQCNVEYKLYHKNVDKGEEVHGSIIQVIIQEFVARKEM